MSGIALRESPSSIALLRNRSPILRLALRFCEHLMLSSEMIIKISV